MSSIFKYLAERAHVDALIDKGQLYLNTLAHFRSYEETKVRGDVHDGQLRYEPSDGLTLTKSTGEVLTLPEWQFRASVRTTEIFVYCMSREKSEALAREFDCPFCVEITDPIKLIGRVNRHVRLRSRLCHEVHHGSVEYRSLETKPGVDWALPEQVAFIKPEAYGRQNEYRIVVGNRAAFDVENVELTLQKGEPENAAEQSKADPLILTVGKLGRIAKLHQF